MTASTTLAPAARRGGAAVRLALAAFALFTGMDSCVKLLSPRYPAAQLACLNALAALLPMLAVAALGGGLRRLRARRRGLQLLRGLCQAAGVPLSFYAYGRMPIADAYAVLFTMPLLIVALSAPLLGERVGWRRWAAVAVGFAGVLVALRPGAGLLGPGTLAAFGAALANALAMLLMRRLGATETAEAVGFHGNLVIAFATAPAAVVVGRLPAIPDLGVSLLGGAFGGCAHMLLARAYQRAPAPAVAPFQYSQMPYGLLAGYLLFGSRPEPAMLLGSLVVIGAGLRLLRREAGPP